MDPPGAFIQAFDESTRTLSRAGVLLQGGKKFQELVGEAGHLRSGDGLEGSQTDVADHDGGEAPIVGTPQRAKPGNLQLGWIDRRRVRRQKWLGHYVAEE
jgi:hypothetical protein